MSLFRKLIESGKSVMANFLHGIVLWRRVDYHFGVIGCLSRSRRAMPHTPRSFLAPSSTCSANIRVTYYAFQY